MNIKDDADPIALSVVWKDAKGKTAKVDPSTPVRFTTSDANLVAIIDNADGTQSAGVGPMDGVDADDAGLIGPPVSVMTQADGDVGEGVELLTAVGQAQIIAGNAKVGTVLFGGQP